MCFDGLDICYFSNSIVNLFFADSNSSDITRKVHRLVEEVKELNYFQGFLDCGSYLKSFYLTVLVIQPCGKTMSVIDDNNLSSIDNLSLIPVQLERTEILQKFYTHNSVKQDSTELCHINNSYSDRCFWKRTTF